MAQAQVPVGRVSALHGQAFVRTSDGQQHELKVGDVVHEGDVIITAAGSDVELTYGAGKTYTIHSNETATLDSTVFAADVPSPVDAALQTNGTQLNNITQAIASGNSLDSLLEETAAGLTGGGGTGDSSHSFVTLLRISESVTPESFNFDSAATGGSGTQTSGTTDRATPTIAVDSITADNIINAAESHQTIAVTGLTGGGALPGDPVTLVVNGHTYTGTVADDHTFSINVAGADLAADSSVTATVTAGTGSGAPSAVAVAAYDVDLTANASINVHAITLDNIINAIEAHGNVAVTGTVGGDVKAGDTVTLTVNGHDYTGTVQTDLSYSISVAGSDLAADTNVHASVTATDNVGNTATATADQAYLVDTVATASISIDSITADNVINAKEAAGNVDVTGTVGGDVKVGDTVTLTVNGHDYSGVVQAGNTYSISVAGNDLAADSSVKASVTVTDDAGNTATGTANHAYGVDTQATATITINAITGDNVINAAEASQNISVTGTVGGDVKAGDTVTLTVNGHDYTGTVSEGLTYSISVKGSDLAAGSNVHGTVTATDDAGNTATATADHAYVVDTQASASLTIDPITGDGVLSAEEAGGPVTVTGHAGGDAHAGDTVTLTVNGHSYSGEVQGNGSYAISVSGSDLAAVSSVHGSVTTTDSFGNSATATADRPYTTDTTASASINLDAITGDNIINSAEAASSNVAVTGTVGGDVKAGDTVTLTVNGHDYTGAVQEDGTTFSINVAGSDLAADTSVHASVTATDGSGNHATATSDQGYTVETTAAASINIDAISGDNIISSSEAAGNVAVTGSVGGDVKAGDTVTLTVNGHDYTGAVQEDGTTFSINVAGSDLAADSNVHASVTGTDAVGNTATATDDQGYTVDTSASASINLDAITGDNIISSAEAASSDVAVTGTVGGDVKTGDTVTLTVNGHDYTGAVQEGGTFSINVSGADLAADSNVHASVTGTDSVGNTATATDDQGYTVDTTASASISIDSITGDNVINATEAAGTVAVTGTVGGDVKAGDTVTLTVNGHDYTGTVHQDGTTFSINVDGGDLAADSNVHASVTGTDSVGNTATATADQGYTVDMTASASIDLDAISGDNIISSAEAAGTVAVTGTVGGDVKAGDTVTLTVNGHDYTGTVHQDGTTFSINVDGGDLAADSNVHASVTGTDGAGNTATATDDQGYTVDTTAAASINLDPVTGDNIISAAEAASSNVAVTGTVGGDVKAGDTVTLTVNGHDYTGAVQEGGTFSINVAGSDLVADSNVHASVTATDTVGNTATATDDQGYTVDTTASASINLDAITGDNVINATEAASSNVAVTGTVGGDVKAGDTVTLTVNGHDYTGTVHQDGTTFSINVSGADLAADSNVHASVTGTDSVGNTATATADQGYTVDTTAAASINLDAVTGDNIINAAEAASSNVAVSGTVGGDVKAGDTVTLTVNGHDYTGAVHQDGTTFSINVSGADLAADSNVHASVTATDGAGNTATATADQGYTVDTTASATISIDAITGDDIVSGTEAAGNVSVTGTVGGDAKPGDTVTLTVNGQTYTGQVAANDTYSISVKGSDLAAVSSIHASVAATDSVGNTATAQADRPYDNAPTATAATIAVSEEGLTGGNVDSVGSPSDTTNLASRTGQMTVGDVDHNSLLVTLTHPTTTVTSGGTALTWTGDGTGQLVGKAGSTTIMTVAIDNTGAYTVTLSGPIDHPDKTAEDVLGINFGVVVNDQHGATTNSTLTVNVEDDSPVWTGITDAALIEGFSGATLTGNLHSSLGADSGSAAKVVFTGATVDGSGNILSTAGQYVTYNNLKLHYETSGGTLYGVASDGTQVFQVSGDAHTGQYDMTMLQSLDSTMAKVVSFGSLHGGQNNVYTLSDTSNLYTITITGTQNGVSAPVNTTSGDMGVANQWMDAGETMKFAFDQKMTGVNVSLDGGKLTTNDHVQYTVHYTDGTTGTGTINGTGASVVTADLQFTHSIDSITFQGLADHYGIKLNSITGTTSKLDQAIQFNAAVVDGDGDTTSNHALTATLSYDGSMAAGSGATAMGGSSMAETLVGSSGDDNIKAGGGDDIITGAGGNDTMAGGLGADTFAWHLGDKGTAGTPAVDKITDFGTAAYTAGGSGDRLDLRDLLQGESQSGGNLTNYLHFEKVGSDTVVHVSSSGGFANGYSAGAEDQKIVLAGVDLAAIYNANSDAAIIQSLIQNHKLVTD